MKKFTNSPCELFLFQAFISSIREEAYVFFADGGARVRWKYVIGGALLSLLLPINAAWSQESLQALLDQAEPGATVTLPEGEFAGPLVINKPLQIEGNGKTILKADAQGPVVTVNGNGTKLSGIHIVQQNKSEKASAIQLKGSHHLLQNIEIDTNGSGILLRDASDNKLRELVIRGSRTEAKSSGKGKAKTQPKGNGIDLWQSHRNEISLNHIQNVQDGVYMEKSNENQLTGNDITGSRYGLHVMYAKNSLLANNNIHHNTTGAMVMEAENTVIDHNTFVDQQTHVFSQGLLLFDTTKSRIVNNRFERNRVGAYLERSGDNEWKANRFEANFIGMQVRTSQRNELTGNSFVGNVVHAQATDSKDNRLVRNYWDDHQGLDARGEGTSSLPYEIDPFFLTVTEAHPGYQLLFQSPGMMLLKELLKTDSETLLVDKSPALVPQMAPDEGKHALSFTGMLWTLLLLTSSMTVFLLGRKSI